MVKQQDNERWTAIGKGAAIGAGGSMLVALGLTAVFAALVDHGSIGEDMINPAGAFILTLSSLAGSLLSAAVIGHHRFAACLSTAVIYFGMLLACTAMLFGGIYQNVGVTALAILGGSGAAILLGLREGRKGRPKRRRKM